MVRQGQRALGAVTLMMAISCLVAAPGAQGPPGAGKSAATITGAFADSCRDFAAYSTKDISYVELHYVTGLVVKDETINSHDHAIDGGAGDEIELATVKSGTTIEEFSCVPSNRAPTARLEIQTPPIDLTIEHCYLFIIGGDDGLVCQWSSPRTVWTSASEIPANSNNQNLLLWGCVIDTSCPFAAGFPFTVSLRGTASSDPDGDITSWSIDFGDGTSASGSWSTAPPAEVGHAYSPGPSGDYCGGAICVITLTVTDSAGQSSSDTMRMAFIDQRPG